MFAGGRRVRRISRTTMRSAQARADERDAASDAGE